jgi:Flp pilus assembly pilin Flp
MRVSMAVIALKRLCGVGLRTEDDGQDLLEYGLLMALIAVFAMGAIATLGNTITTVFWNAIAASF